MGIYMSNSPKIGIKRPIVPDDTVFKRLFNDKRQRSEFSKTVQRFHENAYNAQIAEIAMLEHNLQKKVFHNRNNLGITYEDLRQIIREDNNSNKEIRRDVLT